MTTTTETASRFDPPADWVPQYDRWRHGGWYVANVLHPGGGCGCVSRNYPDRKWRVVCFEDGKTYPNRDAAARAEYAIAEMAKEGWPRCMAGGRYCGGFLHRDEVGNYYDTCWNCGVTSWRDKPGQPFSDPAPVDADDHGAGCDGPLNCVCPSGEGVSV